MVSTTGTLAQKETTKHCLTLSVVLQNLLYVPILNTKMVIYTERQILGKREEHSSINIFRQGINVMPRGRLSKIDMESKIYKLFHELDREQGEKGLTYKYLHKVLDILEEYSS